MMALMALMDSEGEGVGVGTSKGRRSDETRQAKQPAVRAYS